MGKKGSSSKFWNFSFHFRGWSPPELERTLQNVGGSDIHTNINPYGIANYYNHPQLLQHGHFQQLLFQQANEYGVNSEFQCDLENNIILVFLENHMFAIILVF
ncbi:hypothetical protein WN944_000523 [Citrus x changshan-huyou]|uniref:Uncharacterized protein n=1 Tax=Citrus x changshan-huyou TaxID=2935761 RepID=A0AAP0MD23_9ROSI